jgi:hypothetical protein
MMKGPALLCVVELKSRCKVKSSIRRRKAGKSQNVKKKVLVKIRQARVISVKGAPFMRMHPSLVFVNMVGRESHDGCCPQIRALVGCYKQCRECQYHHKQWGDRRQVVDLFTQSFKPCWSPATSSAMSSKVTPYAAMMELLPSVSSASQSPECWRISEREMPWLPWLRRGT